VNGRKVLFTGNEGLDEMGRRMVALCGENQLMELMEFTIRVYGILTDELNGVLVSDEAEYGMRFTKFPGGGMKPGEGTVDCLIREWMEELGQQISVKEHLYTTDFFQPSAFHQHKQLISIYYYVEKVNEPAKKISTIPFDFSEEAEYAQSVRWMAWNEFTPEALTFPVDKLVARMILQTRPSL
jgi:ADP-ribose pyrophosphatase YjhB (NUDIX family)